MIENLIKKQNLDTILEALEADERENVIQNKILFELYEELDKVKNGEAMKQSVEDLLAMVSLVYYAKGMKVGARLNALLMK